MLYQAVARQFVPFHACHAGPNLISTGQNLPCRTGIALHRLAATGPSSPGLP
jgi:hypothetical protein